MSHRVSRGAPRAGAAEGKCRDRSHPAPTRCLPQGHEATPRAAELLGAPPQGRRPAPQPGSPGWTASAWELGTPQPRHFLFHLMGIRPDGRAGRLAIFRARLCNFV